MPSDISSVIALIAFGRLSRMMPADALAPDDQVAFGIGCRCHRRAHRAPSISFRETISRMISLVPSRIWCTRKSRTIFSMPYSLR